MSPFWRGALVTTLAFALFVTSCPAFPNRGTLVGSTLYLRCQ